ncbi:hypothetical protein BDF14DRAFT_1736447, partial [Spinellus fusiger]
HLTHDIRNYIIILDCSYTAIYLLLYSHELNPTKQFWAVVKDIVKPSMFDETEHLKKGITEARDFVEYLTIKLYYQQNRLLMNKSIYYNDMANV